MNRDNKLMNTETRRKHAYRVSPFGGGRGRISAFNLRKSALICVSKDKSEASVLLSSSSLKFNPVSLCLALKRAGINRESYTGLNSSLRE